MIKSITLFLLMTAVEMVIDINFQQCVLLLAFTGSCQIAMLSLSYLLLANNLALKCCMNVLSLLQVKASIAFQIRQREQKTRFCQIIRAFYFLYTSYIMHAKLKLSFFQLANYHSPATTKAS